MSIEQPQRGTYQDDEISLVDLAKILVRRRWWLIGTSVVVFLIALIFSLLPRESSLYQYTSVYQQAETEPGTPLNASESLIQQVENIYWPNYQRAYKNENNTNVLPFELEINNPEETTLITLRSTASGENQSQVISLHKTLLDRVMSHDEDLLKKLRSNVESSIERVSTLMERVEGGDSYTSVEMAVDFADRLFKLENELESLTEGEVLEYADGGDLQEPTLSSTMIIILGIVFGGIAGIIAAFLAEFAGKVRESLKIDTARKY